MTPLQRGGRSKERACLRDSSWEIVAMGDALYLLNGEVTWI